MTEQVTPPTPDDTETPDIFGMTYAGALGVFTVCLVCGSLLAMGDGTKDLHRQWHVVDVAKLGGRARLSARWPTGWAST